jgi:hypothetical protein
MNDRIFTQAEVSDLLSKAARLEGAVGNSSSGLTLAEVKDAARAAGIDPSWVEAALRTSGRTAEAQTYAGITTTVHRERVLPRPIDENQWGRIVAELRRTLGEKGTAESIGGNRAWESGHLRVGIENVDGRAVVNADSDWANDVKGVVWTGALALVTAIGLGFPAYATGEPPLIFFIGVLVLCGLWAGISAWGHRRKAVQLGDKLDVALDQIERIAIQNKAPIKQNAGAGTPISAPPTAAKSDPGEKHKGLLDGAVGYWQGDSAAPDKSRERG